MSHMRKTNGEGEQRGRTINTNKVQGKEGQMKNQRSGLGPKRLQKYRQNQPTLEMFPSLLVHSLHNTSSHKTVPPGLDALGSMAGDSLPLLPVNGRRDGKNNDQACSVNVCQLVMVPQCPPLVTI